MLKLCLIIKKIIILIIKKFLPSTQIIFSLIKLFKDFSISKGDVGIIVPGIYFVIRTL